MVKTKTFLLIIVSKVKFSNLYPIFAISIFCNIAEMKTLLRVLLMSACVFPALAVPDKKPKVIDSYYVDGYGFVCDYENAYFEIKVLQDGDSIKVHSYNLITDNPVSVQTYKVLTDSVQVKWGTQFMFNAEGKVSLFENIDLVRGIDVVIKYDDSTRVEQHVIKDNINKTTKNTTFYPNGRQKNMSLSEWTVDKKHVNTIKSWLPDGQLIRDQRMENGKTVSLKTYDAEGELAFSLPCQDGDSVFYNAEGNIITRKNAVRRGVIRLEGDSIKITSYDNRGRCLSVENYMSYIPENPVSWGVQQYFYADAPQPTDSVWIFRSVNGDNLIEKTFYPDGKLKSSSVMTFDNVMVPNREFRQYYPSGLLRRLEIHHGEKLVEGHIYDNEGNEVFPFYEFQQ